MTKCGKNQEQNINTCPVYSRVELEISNIKEQLTGLNIRMDKIDEKLDTLLQLYSQNNTKVAVLESEVVTLKEKNKELETKLASQERKLWIISLIISSAGIGVSQLIQFL